MPSSATPVSSVVHVSPPDTGSARVSVPIVTISPAAVHDQAALLFRLVMFYLDLGGGLTKRVKNLDCSVTVPLKVGSR